MNQDKKIHEELNSIGLLQIQRLRGFLGACESRLFDDDMVRDGEYTIEETVDRYRIVSKIFGDLWGLSLKQQAVASITQEGSDELESLYHRILSLGQEDISALLGLMQIVKTGVPIAQLMTYAQSCNEAAEPDPPFSPEYAPDDG
ncbi:MAG: hypothetical protein GY847_01790 [Proteobacteria bacterium]|nr:hypothetical protein [Pseudomonadota bacterium]